MAFDDPVACAEGWSREASDKHNELENIRQLCESMQGESGNLLKEIDQLNGEINSLAGEIQALVQGIHNDSTSAGQQAQAANQHIDMVRQTLSDAENLAMSADSDMSLGSGIL